MKPEALSCFRQQLDHPVSLNVKSRLVDFLELPLCLLSHAGIRLELDLNSCITSSFESQLSP
jgi:hypothetical protein